MQRQILMCLVLQRVTVQTITANPAPMTSEQLVDELKPNTHRRHDATRLNCRGELTQFTISCAIELLRLMSSDDILGHNDSLLKNYPNIYRSKFT